MPLILLVRHAQSQANADGVLAGWVEGVGLTDRGREQARALTPRLTSLDLVRVVSSPVQRCLETAHLALADAEWTTEENAGLGECHYGAWTGRPLAELAKEPLWTEVQESPSTATFPESPAYRHESLAQMEARVVGTLEALDDEVAATHGAHAIWVAVSHGDPIKAVLAHAAGAGIAGLQRFHVDPASVSVVRRTGSGADARWMILATNITDRSVGEVVAGARPPKGADEADAVVGGGSGGSGEPGIP